ncbi:MAG TPA: DUF4350 domain-containing protein [Planctomycetota bacterium]|nr:DUF4350 domain-containing protein [Planctomycetota bacterium]
MTRPARLNGDRLLVVWSLVALFAVSVLLAQRPHSLGYDPENQKQGSSQYSSPLGGKAFFTLLGRLGDRPARQTRVLDLLPRDAHELLVLGPSDALLPDEAAGLRDWVARGGTLVACPRLAPADAPPDPILSTFGLEAVLRPDRESAVRGSLVAVDHRDHRSYALRVFQGRRFKPSGNDSRSVALADDEAGWVVGMVPRGAGRLIAIADPDLYSNRGISRADHVEFMVRLSEACSGGGPICFDEYHHGFKEGQSAVAVLWDSPLRPVLLLAVLATFAGVFASGRRLGPAVELHEDRRRRPSEFIDAVAGLCRKLRAGPQALSLMLAEFRLHLQESHGASTPEALERISARAGLAPAAVGNFLEQATRLSKAPAVDDHALLSCCRELESLRTSLRRSPLERTPS